MKSLTQAMLFVDSAHEQQQNRLPQSSGGDPNAMLRIARFLAPVGLVRLSGMVKQQIESSPASEQLKLRLIVLTPGHQAESPEEQRVRDAMQQELVALSTNSKQVIADESGHSIPYDQPELLIESVKELVELVRESGQRPVETAGD